MLQRKTAVMAALALSGALLAGSQWASVQAASAPLPTAQLPAINFPGQPQVPQHPLSPGLNPSYDYSEFTPPAPVQKLPEGFTSIFNGKDLSGWHISKTARHGHTPDFHVLSGMILATQNPVGRGGLLITDNKYNNYELYAEAKADWGADSGIFLRTTEEGAAYQVTLDYLPGGSMGTVIAEGGITVQRAAATPGATPAGPALANGMANWKHNDWNTIRIRVEGETPHVRVWINDVQTADFTDTANHAVGGMVSGPFALQIHGGDARWQPAAFWRWRNIAVRELPAS